MSIGVGYCDTQCKIVSLLFIFDIILTACLISCNDDIPVDKITLSKSWAHFFRSNKFVISPDGILIVFNFNFFKKFKLIKSNGDEINSILFCLQKILIFF